ncbi:hypothetical protein BGX28_001090, partial [Mortierella sp. GBA30]
MIVFESINNLIMPRGKQNEWTLYSKHDFLDALDLRSPRQLLLLGVLTTNDYTRGLDRWGIEKNLKKVRAMTFDDRDLGNVHIVHGAPSSPPVDAPTLARLDAIHDGISHYLGCIPSAKGIDGTELFGHAVEAFVLYKEDKSLAPSASSTNESLGRLIRTMEQNRLRKRLPGERRQQAGEPSAASYSRQPPNRLHDVGAGEKKRCGSKNQSSKNRRRHRYRSINGVGNPRYTPHKVKDIKNATPVSTEDLRDMEVPKPRRPTTALKFNNTPSKSKKEPKKNSTGNRKGGSKGRCSSYQTKKLYSKAFHNITMTLGWWGGCMRRATTLRSDQVEAVADYINKAVHILNMTRSFAYRALDLFVKAALKNGDPEGDLNILLDKSMGRTVLNNLTSCLLNGKVRDRGGTGRSVETVEEAEGNKERLRQAQCLGKHIYALLQDSIGPMQPFKGDQQQMNLKTAQQEMIRAMLTDIR